MACAGLRWVWLFHAARRRDPAPVREYVFESWCPVAEAEPLNMKSVVEAACDGEPVVRVSGASYVRGGYRSFEFADVTARAGEVVALLGGEARAPRDLLLAIAGAVRPTSGSISVGDAAFAASAGAGPLRAALTWGGFQRRLRAAGSVCLGAFAGLTDVGGALTVEEAVGRELAHRRRACGEAPDTLGFLAALGLATHADQRIDRLHPVARARLSAALALASAPRAAVVDLRDPFCAGLTTDEERAVVRDLRALARATDTAILVGCGEAASAAEADVAVALDVAAADALAAAQPVPEGADA